MDGNTETVSMRNSDPVTPANFRFVPLLLVLLVLTSCTHYQIPTAQTKGVYHHIKSGETLWSIARAYKIDIQELAEINNITDPDMIKLDDVVFIPDANHIVEDVMRSAGMTGTSGSVVQKEKDTNLPKGESKIEKSSPTLEKLPAKEFPKDTQLKVSNKSPVKEKRMDSPGPLTGELPSAGADANRSQSGMDAKVATKQADDDYKSDRRDDKTGSVAIKFDRDRFIWPVKGTVRSKFGIQLNGMYFNGIRITAKEGTPVLAAASGTTIFSALLKDYGETIILKHEENYATVYTHLSNRILKVDDRVRKGSRIAVLGKFDKDDEPYINFEIRYKNKARNPLFFLP
jgi:lipoprotein NlpD